MTRDRDIMTERLFDDLARLRDGRMISRSSATALARFDYCFIRETRVYEQGASRKIYRFTITRAGREALRLREISR